MVYGKSLKNMVGNKNYKLIVYTMGALLEVAGLAILFNIQLAAKFFCQNKTVVGLFLIIAGYLMAVGARRR